jgi:hypothetical protein
MSDHSVAAATHNLLSSCSSPELDLVDDIVLPDSQGVHEDWQSLYRYADSEGSDEEYTRRSELGLRIANLSGDEDIEHTKPGQVIP